MFVDALAGEAAQSKQRGPVQRGFARLRGFAEVVAGKGALSKPRGLSRLRVVAAVVAGEGALSKQRGFARLRVLVTGLALLGGPQTLLAQAPAVAPTEDVAMGGRVVVVGNPQDLLSQRIVAELESLGYRSETVTPDPSATADPGALEELARQYEASAAIWVDTATERISIWVVDRVTGKTLLRRVDNDEDDRVVAVRAVELLWSGLLELERDAQPTGSEVPPPPASQRLLRVPNPRYGLHFDVAVGGAPGGLGVGAFGRLGFRWMPRRHMGLGIEGAVPFSAMRGSAAEGAIDARAGWLGLGPRFGWGRPRGRLHGFLGLLGGAMLFAVRGTADAPFESLRDRTIVGFVEITGRIEVGLTPRLRLGLGASGGVGLPIPGIRVDARRAARWGLPFVSGSLGLTVIW